MITVKTVAELRNAVASQRSLGSRVAFVPTMGNLHAGHLSLVRSARERGDFLVVSLYVNPLQFGPSEDLATYPRTVEQDTAELVRAGVDVLFMPDDSVMYPRGPEQQTKVEVPQLGTILCGVSRPIFFRGITTVVARLFNMVQPDLAVFGKKDYQQLTIIRRMVEDLSVPVEIVGVDTVREADGLAMSSRNNYLDAEQRKVAPLLFRTLKQAAAALRANESDIAATERQSVEVLAAAGFGLDYFSVRRQNDLAAARPGDGRSVILAAAMLGRARLIDNLELDL